MNKRFRVAIAGCHRMLERKVANHNWAAAFARDPRMEIVAVFDKDAETRQAFVDAWGPIPAFDDYATMLREIQPDIVCIATRQTMHADQVEAAAAAGVKGILCEKPLATSLREVDRIVAAVEPRDIKFGFGTERRWSPYYRALQEALTGGEIGEVRSVVAFGLRNFIFVGCHWLDRVLALAGDPEIAWVAAELESPSGELDTESALSRRRLDPTGRCQIQFANGVEAFVTSSAPTPAFDLGFDVVGTRGRLVILGDGAVSQLWHVSTDGKVIEPSPAPVQSFTPPWPLVVADLGDALEQNRPTLGDIHCARRATELGFAAHWSHQHGGRRVTVSEVDRDLKIESLPWGNE